MSCDRYLFLLAALMAALAGCAVQGAPFKKASAPPQHAVIYVYRPYSYAGSLLRPPVTCGDETARIGPGGYHAFIVAAGKVTCDVPGEAGDAVELDAEPRVYYIREAIGWGVLSGHPHLDPIDTDQAQTEIQRCCVREPDDRSTAAAQ
jgi:hypothetical protein